LKIEPTADAFGFKPDNEPKFFLVYEEEGELFALVDYSVSSKGSRFPLKTFSSKLKAEAFATVEGLNIHSINPL
jgi:hypothetical protein